MLGSTTATFGRRLGPRALREVDQHPGEVVGDGVDRVDDDLGAGDRFVEPASAFDPFLQRFVKNHFGEGKFNGHRKETLPDGVTPRFADKLGAKHPKAGLQPLVSAVYDPKAAASAKG